MKNTPDARKRPKYMRAFPEGILLVADCKFPGILLTCLDTTLKVPETVSLADLTADSISKEAKLPEPPESFAVEAYEFQSANNDEAGADEAFGSELGLSSLPLPVNQFIFLLVCVYSIGVDREEDGGGGGDW